LATALWHGALGADEAVLDMSIPTAKGACGLHARRAGAAGMFSNLTIFTGILIFYRRHVRHIHRCPRFGTHRATDTNGVEHVVCRRHHPDLGAGHKLLPDHLVAHRT